MSDSMSIFSRCSMVPVVKLVLYQKKLLKKRILIGILFLFSPWVYSQNLNRNSILVGDQSAGLGGAYVALFEDITGAPFYNPGGLTFVEGESVSASVGVYKKFDLQYGVGTDFLSASLKMNQGFFRAVPASTGVLLRFDELNFLKPYTFVFSIIVPTFEEFSGELMRNTSTVKSLDYKKETLWVGGSVSRSIYSDMGVGLSLFYTADTQKVYRGTRGFSPDEYYESEIRSFKSNSLVTILGIQYKINQFHRLGLRYQLPAVHLAGWGEREYFKFDSNGMTGGAPQTEIESRQLHPGNFSFGYSYLDTKFIISIDFQYSLGSIEKDFESSSFYDDYRTREILNYAIGLEYKLNDRFAVRSGVFSNKSPHFENLIQSNRWQADYINGEGFSGNIVWTKGQTEYTFGGYYVGGRGHAWHKDSLGYAQVDKQMHIFTMLVGLNHKI